MINKIHLIDVLDGLSKIESETADIVLIDPPYNIGKNFGNSNDKMELMAYIDWSKLWMNESIRILKPTGTIYIYGFPEILAHISVNFDLEHRWLAWHYTNKNVVGYNFWQRSYESIICGWKNTKDRIFNIDNVREPYCEASIQNAESGRVRTTTKGRGRFQKSDKQTVYKVHELGAMPRDVIKVPALAGGAGKAERWFFCKTCDDAFSNYNMKDHENHDLIIHPTQKPKELTKKLLTASMPQSNGLVVVPFAGTGSEIIIINELNMNYIGFDINPDYIKLAEKTLKKSQEILHPVKEEFEELFK